MQIPYRKPGKYAQMKPDPLMTKEKLLALEQKLSRLKSHRPQLAAEVARLAELGDFSENAEYQLAKGKLRGLNAAILALETQINQAEIISPLKNINTIQIGSVVTVLNENGQKTYQILGSAEADPKKGVISHTSPLGAALVGSKLDDVITIDSSGKKTDYKIIKIV